MSIEIESKDVDVRKIMNEIRERTSRYSGRYRPAWRMIQMGVRSHGSPPRVFRKMLSLRAAMRVRPRP